MSFRILLIEDDPELGEFVAQGLREEGYVVELAAEGGFVEAAELAGVRGKDDPRVGADAIAQLGALGEQRQGIGIQDRGQPAV